MPSTVVDYTRTEAAPVPVDLPERTANAAASKDLADTLTPTPPGAIARVGAISQLEAMPSSFNPGFHTDASLRALITAGDTLGRVVQGVISSKMVFVQLTAGTDAEVSGAVWRPTDYDASTNARVWKVVGGGGGDGTVQPSFTSLAELRAIVTPGLRLGVVLQGTFSDSLAGVQLVASTDADAPSSGTYRPNDYDPATNARVWKLVSPVYPPNMKITHILLGFTAVFGLLTSACATNPPAQMQVDAGTYILRWPSAAQLRDAGDFVMTNGTYNNPSWLTHVAWSKVTGTPQTLSALGITNGATLDAIVAAPVSSVQGKTGAVTLSKSDLNMGSVDNTTDVNKPISTATQAALDLKADSASLGTAAMKSVPATGDAADDEVVLGSDSRLGAGGSFGSLGGEPDDNAVLAAELAAKASAPTIAALPSDTLTLASGVFPTYTTTISTDRTFSVSPGFTPGQGIQIEALVTGTSHTLHHDAVYRNGAVNTTGTSPITPGRHHISIWSPDGTILFWNDSVFQQPGELQFIFAEWGDGAGAVRITAEGAGFGHFAFSGTAAKTANYIIYRFQVPRDFDPSVVMTAVIHQKLGGADTGKQSYELSMADVAPSANVAAPTFSNAIAVNFPGDASGASGDLESSAETTLTDWSSSLTPGHICLVKVARAGDDATNDTSSVSSQDVALVLYHGKIQ